MRIITGALAFFESSAGIAIVDRARNLAAEAAARVLADQHDLVCASAADADPRATAATVCTVLCVEPCM